MSKTRQTRRPVGAAAHSPRSFRCPDSVWEKAKRRADLENSTMSHVVLSLIEAYAEGYVKLPERQTVYTPTTIKPAESNYGM